MSRELQQEPSASSPFDRIRHVDPEGEYWLAREMPAHLGYSRWEYMDKVIGRAKSACRNNGHAIEDHFREVPKLVEAGSGAIRSLVDCRLSRYACYLVAMNGDPDKPEVAAAQSYFVVMTRAAEVASIPDDPLELDLLRTRMIVRAMEGVISARKELGEVKSAVRALTDRTEAGLDDLRGQLAEVKAAVSGEPRPLKPGDFVMIKDFDRLRKIGLTAKQRQHFGWKISIECRAEGVEPGVRDGIYQGQPTRTGTYPVRILERWESRMRAMVANTTMRLFDAGADHA